MLATPLKRKGHVSRKESTCGAAIQHNDSNWGDALTTLHDDTPTTRILFLNIGGLSPFPHSKKLTELKNLLTNTQTDIAALAEINVNWHRIPADRKLPELLYGWRETRPRLTTAFLANSPVEGWHNYGGTSVWAFQTARDRSSTTGGDPRGLGRWSWMRFQGHQGFTLRVVSCYRPNRKQTNKARSVWSQQRVVLDERDIDADPRALFLTDLAEEVTSWLAAGEQVIVGADLNEDISSDAIRTTLLRAGLTDICTTRHGRPPPTSTEGSSPIDGIFVSSTLRSCRCGILDFYNSMDHRPVWIDVPHSLAFGYNVEHPAPRRLTRLNLKDARCVTRYYDLLRSRLDDHQIATRLANLADSTTPGTPLTTDQAREYDAIHWEHLQSVLFAEKNCRRLRAGAVPFSPGYNKIVNSIRYWRSVIKRTTNRSKVDRKLMRRFARKAGIPYDPTQWSTEHAKLSLKKLYKLNDRMKKDDYCRAKQARTDFIERLALAQEQAGRMDRATFRRQLLLQEKQRCDARLIKRSQHKLRGGSVLMVDGPAFHEDGSPDTTAPWRSYTLKEDIEKACCWENARRFRQACNTPPCQEPMFTSLGPLGTTDFSNDVLLGKATAPGNTDQWLVKLLDQLQYLPDVASGTQVNLSITPEKLAKAWRTARVTTAPGPSGYTFAQFKAHAQPEADDLIAIDARMLSIPYQTGYSPKLWQQGINCMLEKKKGNFRVDKLRAILLYEAQFNMMNKIMGRDVMAAAESLGGVAPEQYGSRKNHSSINLGLNKRLTFDLFRQRKQSGALCSNDAKSCFDRIAHSIASLALQRVGLPPEPIICMFTTIQQLEHKIRTAYGVSTSGFTGKLWAVPIQGVGQGNAPAHKFGHS